MGACYTRQSVARSLTCLGQCGSVGVFAGASKGCEFNPWSVRVTEAADQQVSLSPSPHLSLPLPISPSLHLQHPRVNISCPRVRIKKRKFNSMHFFLLLNLVFAACPGSKVEAKSPVVWVTPVAPGYIKSVA